jgi:hypothetical protein
MIGPPLDNKNGIKLKDPDIRQEAYRQYCAHLAKGKSKRSFVFRHPEFSCHWVTLESYIKDKVEFDPVQMELAKCEGYARWEQVVEDSAEGKNKDANTASLQMLMRNKYDWDKKEEVQQQQATEQIQFAISEAKDMNVKNNDQPLPKTGNVPQGGDSQD